jgi:hypothetical protein
MENRVRHMTDMAQVTQRKLTDCEERLEDLPILREKYYQTL